MARSFSSAWRRIYQLAWAGDFPDRTCKTCGYCTYPHRQIEFARHCLANWLNLGIARRRLANLRPLGDLQRPPPEGPWCRHRLHHLRCRCLFPSWPAPFRCPGPTTSCSSAAAARPKPSPSTRPKPCAAAGRCASSSAKWTASSTNEPPCRVTRLPCSAKAPSRSQAMPSALTRKSDILLSSNFSACATSIPRATLKMPSSATWKLFFSN